MAFGQGVVNRWYSLEYSGHLGDPWQAMPGQGDVKGSGGLDSLVDTNAPATDRHYRLNVDMK